MDRDINERIKPEEYLAWLDKLFEGYVDVGTNFEEIFPEEKVK